MLDENVENHFHTVETAIDDLRAEIRANQQTLLDFMDRIAPAPAPTSPTAPIRVRPILSIRSHSPLLPPTPSIERRKPAKPSLPADFDGDRSKGKAFLQSCRTYIRLSPETFDSDTMKIVWAMSYMKSGRAGRWVSWEFEIEATSESGSLRFYDWRDFEDEFCKVFTPLNAEATAVNTLETTAYFQGKRSCYDFKRSGYECSYSPTVSCSKSSSLGCCPKAVVTWMFFS